jgi:signal transduction histidine kinase
MRRSLRARAVVGAVAVVGVALLVGAVAMVLLTRSSLTGNVREAAELRAEDVATALREGGASPTDLAVEDEEDGFIQVVGAGGEVVASSENVAGAEAVAELDDEGSTTLDDGPIGSERFVVVGLEAEDDGQDVTVLVGRALDGADEATWALVMALAVVVPLVLLVVGLVAWTLVGRALAPVAAMTTAAQAITDTDLDRRLPDAGSADELGQLGRTLNAMLDRLAEGRDRLSAFVADAAHELRSPLTALRQHAEVAAEHPDATDTAELAVVVRGEGLRLQALVDDLLLLARADQGRAGPAARAVDLDDVVAAVLARRPPQPNRSIDTSAVSGGQVHGDPSALDRLVANLVDNAVRHAAARVAVAVREDDGGTVTLVVEDDGPGVPLADRDRIFERFVRLDEARSRDAGGSGLGLAIVRAVARDHGATVTVGEGRDGGARFEVVYPG